ncbi:TetR/AcrR family transcriptional regulator [Corticibacter populi]|uniref:TetR/AcrR family transcriptional regulator n=1 Tax=Corticibacter populi TaxID=1550736 RepID=A0A3M6QRU6_9BURK|nr:TetR/AcrR family transcriptional regulator [Corticibacter populi]RMX05760.1 TetR/AcrR family transcriptional regulator [Corticibacter populi]RZS30939.1 TetR family transcriptional regulator [Corticibacter populi]
MNKPLKPRRRPSQSRAWMTSVAIQDAFVISLIENGYESVSMRDIANLAGVGLGTLYLYFPNKESIAAVTIRRWLRQLAREIDRVAGSERLPTLRERAHALVAADLAVIYARLPAWRALMELERRITEPELYRQMYRHFVQVVADCFAGAIDWPAGRDAQPVAFLAFSLLCSATRDALLVLDEMPAQAQWEPALQASIWAGITQALGNPALPA